MKFVVMIVGCILYSECMLEIRCKIIRKDGGCNILNYLFVSFWYVKVWYVYGINC